MKVPGKRWLLATTVVLGVYTLAGFWLVPRLIQDRLPALAQTQLGAQASVGPVAFNPYTLRLTLQDLSLAEGDGTPLATLERLTLDLEWSSLLRRAWTLAEIRLTAPRVQLTIAANGDFNLARLLAARPRPPEAAPAAVLPRLIIEQLVLEQGQLSLRDEQAGYRNQYAPIDFTLAGFSTLPERSGDYSFSATSAQGGTLRWKGSASVNPIRGSGEFVLEDLSLPQLAVYLPAAAGVRVHSGRLSATLPYRFAYAAGKLEGGLDAARLLLRQPRLSVDKTQPPLQLGADDATLTLELDAAQAAGQSKLKLGQATFALKDLTVASGPQTPIKIARLGFADGSLDLTARRLRLGRLEAEGGQLQLTRDKQGQLNLLNLLGAFNTPAPQPATPAQPKTRPWTAAVDKVALRQFGADIEDQGTGIRLQVQDGALTLEGAGTDLTQPWRYETSLTLREGGKLASKGSVVPASRALQADLSVQQLALAPLQPLLDQYLKLRIAGGKVSAQGQLTTAQEGRQKAALRYAGSLSIDGLALTEEDGDLFAGWKSVSAGRLSASLQPTRLNIPELRVVEANAKLHIDADRSFNAARLRVRPATAAPAGDTAVKAPETTAAEAEPFVIQIRRVRLHQGKLDFADLSLMPPFAAQIHELNGMVNGLSSRQDARSQIELDGRVDSYGLARVRGELNPFHPTDNTNLQAVFQNVDMVPSSPYMAKFTGYKLADGRISLDLGYTVRNGQLEGSNQIVMDRLKLGERVDSPDSLNLPVELAIALLTNSEGRIDIDLPVSGDTKDPKFSYGGLVWQAIGQFIGKVVSSPFRALGNLLGVRGEELEAVRFEPGSARLLPPEREKLKQVAQMLAQRTQLKLSVPGHYSEAADGAALRARAVRLAVARRAGLQLEAGEEPGAPNLGDRTVREALRDLYAERFGAAELEQQRKAAEQATQAQATDGKPPLLQRMGRLMQGEPQVADIGPFYAGLQQRLEQTEPLAADALPALGAQRASVILEALKAEGVDAQSAATSAPAGVDGAAGQQVALKLELTAK
jgi:uncharacterized protein involved in outer membrane biogenesis